jgi:hypothetical protein
MINVILTFDYELFFNEMYGTEEEILINPTYKILEMLKETNINATFFADAICFKNYSEISTSTFGISVKKQIQFIHNSGNDVQFHLHPIWEKSDYQNGKWSFNQKYYTLENFSNDEVTKIISDGVNYLKSVISKSDYKCIAYRAGGFCLLNNPFVLTELIKNGIFIDSSVLKKSVNKSVNQPYNYNRVPKEENWYFDVNFNRLSHQYNSGSLYEIPIGSTRKIPQKWIITKKYKLNSNHIVLGKQSQIPKNLKGIKKYFSRVKSAFDPTQLNADQLHYKSLLLLLNDYSKKYKNSDVFISLIAHPKFQNDLTISNLQLFIHECKNNTNIRFMTMKDVYDKMIKNPVD